MRCLSAAFVLVLAALVWLPSAGFADDGLAIVHPPHWDQSLAIVQATGAPLDVAEQTDGSTVDGHELGEGSDHNDHARSNGGGATFSPSDDLPLAITTFSTSE
jgi:hypothetical protein